jgi:hypothetical protein
VRQDVPEIDVTMVKAPRGRARRRPLPRDQLPTDGCRRATAGAEEEERLRLRRPTAARARGWALVGGLGVAALVTRRRRRR